jgi:hypothetical protein
MLAAGALDGVAVELPLGADPSRAAEAFAPLAHEEESCCDGEGPECAGHEHSHRHGPAPGCGHDHGHTHDHGPGCGHEHGPGPHRDGEDSAAAEGGEGERDGDEGDEEGAVSRRLAATARVLSGTCRLAACATVVAAAALAGGLATLEPAAGGGGGGRHAAEALLDQVR